MATVQFSDLTEVVKCPICLNTLLHPKTLHCGHVCCKHCLDSIVKFGKNGVAWISCPKKCPQLTKMTAKQTTDDLLSNYIAEGIVDKINLSTKEKIACHSHCDEEDVPDCDSCCAHPNYYVASERKFLCFSCIEGSTQQSATRIEHNVFSNKLVILCKEHETCAATHFCCNQFICMYCVNRGPHKGHIMMLTLSQLEKTLTKQISDQRKSNPGAFWLCWRAPDRERKALEKKVKQDLVFNKLECLSDYLQVLNEKEDVLQKLLDKKLTRHMEDTVPAAHLMGCLNRNTSYFLLERPNILSSIKKISDGVVEPSSTLTISLSGRSSDDVDNPLGVLNKVVVKCSRSSGNKSTNAKYFDASMNIGPGPRQLSNSLCHQINNMSLACYGDWSIPSICKAVEIKDGRSGIYLSRRVERFSEREEIGDGGEGAGEEIEIGNRKWSMSLKARDSCVRMFIYCSPVLDGVIDVMAVARNNKKVYSMVNLHKSDGHYPYSCLSHFFDSMDWEEGPLGQGSVEPGNEDCVTIEAFVQHIPPDCLSQDQELTEIKDGFLVVGNKRKR